MNRFIQNEWTDVNFVVEGKAAHAIYFIWLCMCVFAVCVYRCVFYCMCVNANAWPFSQRINRSSVAEVTGEIRDWLCPRLSHHPSSSAICVHVWLCVCAGMCTWIVVKKKYRWKIFSSTITSLKPDRFSWLVFSWGYFSLLHNCLHTLRIIN